MHDIGEFTDNLGGFMSNESRLLGYNNLSISALLFKIMHLFIPNLTADRKSFICINLILVIAIFVMSTICAVVTKSDFSRAVICSSIVILIPSISYFYVLIFTVFPLMEYFNVMEAMPERKSKLYLGAFLFLYSLLLVLPKFFVPHSVIIILMLLFEIKGVIKNEMIGKWRQTVAL